MRGEIQPDVWLFDDSPSLAISKSQTFDFDVDVPSVIFLIGVHWVMGALDKRIVGSIGIAAALLFIVSAVLLLMNGGEVAADSNKTALYVLAVAGILAVVQSVTVVLERSSFVKTMGGVVCALAGVLFLATPFVGESTGTLLSVAVIVAAIAVILDMLAMWVSRIYGAMYVSAVLAALVFAMGVLSFGSSGVNYYCYAPVIFALWFVLSAVIVMLVEKEVSVRTREIKEDAVSEKSKIQKPKAKNTKATKKAKKAEKKVEAPKEDADEAPKEEPAKEAPATEAPKEAPRPKVRTVELPKKGLEQAKAAQAAKAAKEVPKEEPAKEAPKEEPKPQVPPAKSMNDFMKKLMSSENANRVKEAPKEEPAKEAPKEEPKPKELPEEAVPEPVEIPEESHKDEVEAEPSIDQTAEEPEDAVAEVAEPESSEEIPSEEPEEAVPEPDEIPEEPEDESVETTVPEPTEEGAITEAVGDDSTEESVAEVPVDEGIEYEPSPADEPSVEELPEEAVAEAPEEQPSFKIDEEPQPDWTMVTQDSAVDSVDEEQPMPEEEPVFEEPAEVPEEGPAVEESANESAAVEEAPAEEAVSEPVPEIATEMPSGQSESVSSEDEELGEDLYTDYSPEAVVRRAAWNKGLRCRRGYGEYNIPVAFVKGKVAVYVDDDEPDTTNDAALTDAGWTILRYSASDVTDGKAQGEEIAAAVKANMRASKPKKKSKK